MDDFSMDFVSRYDPHVNALQGELSLPPWMRPQSEQPQQPQQQQALLPSTTAAATTTTITTAATIPPPCDIVETAPTFLISHDDIFNLGHLLYPTLPYHTLLPAILPHLLMPPMSPPLPPPPPTTTTTPRSLSE